MGLRAGASALSKDGVTGGRRGETRLDELTLVNKTLESDESRLLETGLSYHSLARQTDSRGARARFWSSPSAAVVCLLEDKTTALINRIGFRVFS